jgi:TolB protein
MPSDSRNKLRLPLMVAAGLLWASSPAFAQEEEGFPGVSLGLLYESAYVPTVAVKPFTGRMGGASVASPAGAIVARDLRYSDRFEILDSIPASLVGEGVDYRLWDQIGADWVITGEVEGVGDEFVLNLQLHDIIDGAPRERARIPLPAMDSPGFRMAVHTASDLVVRWITGEPGMAASRIAFSRQVANRDGEVTKELYLVDSDGENLRRLTSAGSISLSPAWSPDGKKLLYNSFKSGVPEIYEMDLATRSERTLEVGRGGQFMTPTYHPNGREVVFSILDGRRSGLFSYDLSRGCCLAHLSGGRWNDQSPSFSSDGSRLAFESNRLGDAVPQIYVMDSQGGEADLISPYAYGRGGYYTSPDWSPTGDRVAFHGRIRSGRYHILVADVADRGRRVIQLTTEGNNEDPSWAPDGRHIVFVGERNWGYGLFAVDAVTGRLRLIVGGIRASVPEWSSTLHEAPQGGLPGGSR